MGKKDILSPLILKLHMIYLFYHLPLILSTHTFLFEFILNTNTTMISNVLEISEYITEGTILAIYDKNSGV